MFGQKLLSSSLNYCTKRWKLNYILSRTMLVMINNKKTTTRKEVKHESVRIKRIVLDLHGVIVNSLFSSFVFLALYRCWEEKFCLNH